MPRYVKPINTFEGVIEKDFMQDMISKGRHGNRFNSVGKDHAKE